MTLHADCYNTVTCRPPQGIDYYDSVLIAKSADMFVQQPHGNILLRSENIVSTKITVLLALWGSILLIGKDTIQVVSKEHFLEAVWDVGSAFACLILECVGRSGKCSTPFR